MLGLVLIGIGAPHCLAQSLTLIDSLPTDWSGYTNTLGDIRLADISNDGRTAVGLISSRRLQGSWLPTKNFMNVPIFLLDADVSSFRHSITEPVMFRDGRLWPLEVPTVNGFRSGWAAFISGDGQRVYGAIASGTKVVSGISGYPSPVQVFVWNAGYWTLDGSWHSLEVGPDTYPLGASRDSGRIVVGSSSNYPPDLLAKNGVIRTAAGSDPFAFESWLTMKLVDGNGNIPDISVGPYWYDLMVSKDGRSLFGEYGGPGPSSGLYRVRDGNVTWMNLSYDLAGSGNRFTDATADGNTVFVSQSNWNIAYHGESSLVWSDAAGWERAVHWFAARGIALPDSNTEMEAFAVYAVSDNGRFFAGMMTGLPPTGFVVALANPCRADFNSDTQVDDADFIIFLSAYNTLDCADPAMPAGCPADLNADGFVDDSDFTLFVVAYNELVCP